MAKFTTFKGYSGDKPPTIPKPDAPPEPMIVTVQEGRQANDAAVTRCSDGRTNELHLGPFVANFERESFALLTCIG